MQTAGGAGGFEPMEGRRVRSLLLISVAIFFLMAHSARSQNRGTSAKKSAASAWVESTLRKMSVDEKIGQLLFATYHGSFTSTDAAAYQQILHDVNDLH